MATRRKPKSFFQMTAVQKKEFVRKLEKGIPASRLKPLSSEDRKLWRAAKRGRGRPPMPPGSKAVPVRVTFEPKLLRQIDAYASSNGMSRAELLARGARMAMGK